MCKALPSTVDTGLFPDEENCLPFFFFLKWLQLLAVHRPSLVEKVACGRSSNRPETTCKEKKIHFTYIIRQMKSRVMSNIPWNEKKRAIVKTSEACVYVFFYPPHLENVYISYMHFKKLIKTKILLYSLSLKTNFTAYFWLIRRWKHTETNQIFLARQFKWQKKANNANLTCQRHLVINGCKKQIEETPMKIWYHKSNGLILILKVAVLF